MALENTCISPDFMSSRLDSFACRFQLINSGLPFFSQINKQKSKWIKIFSVHPLIVDIIHGVCVHRTILGCDNIISEVNVSSWTEPLIGCILF